MAHRPPAPDSGTGSCQGGRPAILLPRNLALAQLEQNAVDEVAALLGGKS